MRLRQWIAIGIVVLFANRHGLGLEPTTAFQAFVQKQGLQLRSNDPPAASLDDWNRRRTTLRKTMQELLGGFPATDCDLTPRTFGEFQRDGYRVEKLAFQTRPGVWMTANAYVPGKPGRHPAILHVHGHWKGAKQDPVVQARCIGCAKLGFFVLCVDAFGAGERGIEKSLGQYHGEMTAATLLPVGLPLAGLQVYENKRAVDYLLTRPEVDGQRIGITGASGGGNQTMYAGAMDERLRCVVPTCSVGTYQSYLSAACCLCELVPGALRFTEEGDLLGLAADRGVMITSATQDAYQFSVGEAQKTFARLEGIARLFPQAKVRHTIIESPHAYNQAMREAMYGWMTLHLKGEGDGSPIPDPDIRPEDPEMLRCFPGDSRPDDFVTIPQFAAAEARRLLQQSAAAAEDRSTRETARVDQVAKLSKLLGGFPSATPLQLKSERDLSGNRQILTYQAESNMTLVAHCDLAEKPHRLAMVLDLDGGADQAWSSDMAKRLRSEGWAIVAPELRATGRFANAGDKIGNAVDHNTAEWAMWIGRPLLGQWVYDIHRTLDAIQELHGELPNDILIVGKGSSGVVALCSTALDERIKRVTAIDSLATYVTDRPYRGFRLGLMVPGILKEFGDIPEIVSLIAPRSVTIQGGQRGDGDALDQSQLEQTFRSTQRVFDQLDADNRFLLLKASQ
ncbi:alpha/beta hydrolase family protein [Schlesneria paludicola]|uniref:alpha/beta hydrolase family protein n=1 Tax=Schlesneria paludicola TaxID=360056 RepID=UPI000299E827|nr:alpha/beta hydrolase family protein [Schlesneria paludicola]